MPETHEFASSGDPGDGSAGIQAKAAEAAEQAREQAQRAAGQVQDKLREQIDQRSSQVATQVTEQASDLRLVSESLRQQGKDGPAQAADQLAQYAEKVGGYLRERDSDALLADAEDFGRRQPWAVAAGGLALGFAASRFLKASSRQRYQRRPMTVPRPSGVYTASTGSGGDGAAQPSPQAPGLAAGRAM
jgi:hypothetical protein